jgi:hypothetical protein
VPLKGISVCNEYEVNLEQKKPFALTSGLYYKRVTIVIDPPSVVKVTLQIVVSLTIVIEDARLRQS